MNPVFSYKKYPILEELRRNLQVSPQGRDRNPLLPEALFLQKPYALGGGEFALINKRDLAQGHLVVEGI